MCFGKMGRAEEGIGGEWGHVTAGCLLALLGQYCFLCEAEKGALFSFQSN